MVHAKRIAAATIGTILAAAFSPAQAKDDRLDRVFVIVMENHDLDKVIGTTDSDGVPLTPFLAHLSATYGIESSYFGVTHPSLPNYIAIIGGNVFSVKNNHGSCFSATPPSPCNSISAPSLVDQLEEHGLSWEGLFESMPSVGFLGTSFPENGKELYVQKHNPFVYFQDIVSSPQRLARLKPFVLDELKSELSSPSSASRFVFIVPNQCSSQHGAKSCNTDALALAASDAFLKETVPVIINSPAFTERAVLFIVWDESEGAGEEGCCGVPGGGRIPLIAITKHNAPIKDATPSNHYSLLATIEDGFGLPRLGNAKDAATLFKVLPDSARF